MKSSKKDNKNKIQIDDSIFANPAKTFSLYMELVEECEWDAEYADLLVDQAMTVLTNMYEYSQHDKTLITNRDEFNKIFSANMNSITEQQRNKILALLDDHLENSAKELTSNKTRN